MLRSAKEWQLPPSMLISGDSDGLTPVWELRDRLIVLAFSMFEASLCSGCAEPRNRAYNPDMADKYQVHPVPCYGCRNLEETSSKQKNARGMKNYLTFPPDVVVEPYEFKVVPVDQEMWDEVNSL